MRKILFRGKRADNDEWVEGWYIHGKKYHYIVTACENENCVVYGHYADGVEMYVVDPETVGQCTGLTDKNGKQIFEGDIIEHHAQGDILVNRGVVKVNWDAQNIRWAHQHFALYNPVAYEVIGNVHDNKLEEFENGKWANDEMV